MSAPQSARLRRWTARVAVIELGLGLTMVLVSLVNPTTIAGAPSVSLAASPERAATAAVTTTTAEGIRSGPPIKAPANRSPVPPPRRVVRAPTGPPAVPLLGPRSTGPGSGGDPADFRVWFPGVGPHGGPARWDPCRTITVAGGPALTGPILSELTAITGLDFAVVAKPAQIEITTGVVNSSELASTHDDWAGGWMTDAKIMLSPGVGSRLPTVLRHELGHALGLAHSRGLAEVMTPGSFADDYSAGDVNGLRQLGTLAGPSCP